MRLPLFLMSHINLWLLCLSLLQSVRQIWDSVFDLCLCSLQGFELIGQPAFCFQGHPEASPGPHDIDVLFEKFAKSLAGRRAG